MKTAGRTVIERTRALLRDTEGAQLVEFAFTLPLLIVVAVGIFDFGSAFTLKEKLVGVAQMGARVGANQPSTDLTVTGLACNQLISVCAVRDVVDHALLDSKMNDCGLAAVAPASGGSLIWTFTANAGCPGSLVLKIERSYVYHTNLVAPFNTTPYQIAGTRVTLSYPYQWQFNKVIGLLGPGFTGPAQIKTVAVMQNIN